MIFLSLPAVHTAPPEQLCLQRYENISESGTGLLKTACPHTAPATPFRTRRTGRHRSQRVPRLPAIATQQLPSYPSPPPVRARPAPGSRLPLAACRLPRPAPPPPVFRGHGRRTGLPPFPPAFFRFTVASHACVPFPTPAPPLHRTVMKLPAGLPTRSRNPRRRPSAPPSSAPHTLSAGAQKNKAGPLRMEQPRMQTDPQGN